MTEIGPSWGKLCSTKIFKQMEKYMFIFSGGNPSHLSPEAQQANMGQWFAWVEKLRKENRYVSGEALLPAGKTIKGYEGIKRRG